MLMALAVFCHADAHPALHAPGNSAYAPALRKFSGIPSIAASPVNGRLWACWYTGISAGENSDNYAVLATSADNGATWKEVIIADPDKRGPLRYFDGEVWISPDGKLRWSFTERFCKTLAVDKLGYTGEPSSDRLLMVTLDGEREPVEPYPQPHEIAKGVMMCKPTVLQDGTWLFPVAHWYHAPSACFYASTDGGTTFALRGGVTVPEQLREYDEHQAVQLGDGLLLAFIRCKRIGAMESISTDGGWTWSAPAPSKIGHPNSRRFVMRLANGHLLLVKHGKMGEHPTGTSDWLPRRELRAFVSKDDGKTWQGDLLIDDRAEVSYPDGCQTPDGSVTVIYDRARYKDQAIHFCRFTEDDVLTGRLVSPNSALRCNISSIK